MNKSERFSNTWTILLILFGALAMLVSGCSGAAVKEESAAETAFSPSAPTGPSPKYEDFPDILTPAELTKKPKESFTSKTPGNSEGFIVLEGKVEADSLAAFFENKMADDNWRHLSTMKINLKPVIMLFEKDNRACVIRIEESSFKTRVEIWVAPISKGTVIN